MARRSLNYNPFDPGHKREKQAFRRIGKTIDGIAKVGYITYKEHKKNKKDSQTTTSYQSAASDNINESTSMIGCGIFAIGLISGVIAFFLNENFSNGLSWFIVIALISFIIASLVTIFSKPSKVVVKETQDNTNPKTQNKIVDSSVEKIEELYEKMQTMEPTYEIIDTISALSSNEKKVTALRIALLQFLNSTSKYPNISIEKEEYIDKLIETFSLSDIQSSQEYINFIKTLVIQDMLNGKTPTRNSFNGPINLQKGEIPIWVFNDTVYYEEVTERVHVGASNGLSIKIAKGIYYRVGAFKGQSLTKSSLKAKYGGDLILTNKNISKHSIKCPLSPLQLDCTFAVAIV